MYVNTRVSFALDSYGHTLANVRLEMKAFPLLSPHHPPSFMGLLVVHLLKFKEPVYSAESGLIFLIEMKETCNI